VAALIVAAVHALQVFVLPYFGLGSALHQWTVLLATYAVLAFFVVSGFMIFVSVQRHRAPDGSFDAGGFALARVLRIYPPLAAALLVTIACYLVIQGFDLHGAASYRLGGELFLSREKAVMEWHLLPTTFLLLYDVVPVKFPLGPVSMNGPLWTLSYEFWFYILAMVGVSAIAHRRLWTGRVPLLLLAGMLLHGWNKLLFAFLLVWGAGYLLGYLYTRDFLRHRRFVAGAAACAAACCALLLVGERDLDRYLYNPFVGRARLTLALTGVLLAIGIALAMRAAAHRQAAPRAGLAARTAGFSYTLYIVHYPLLLLGFSFLHPMTHGHHWTIALLAAAAALAAAILVAERLARFVENRDLIRRLVVPRKWLSSAAT